MPAWRWVVTTYFAEGMPYGVVHKLANVLFTEMQASLQLVGMTALFHLPWNLKFLWGPYVDEYETKRRWLIALEVTLAVALVLLAIATQSEYALAATAGAFVLTAFLAATHDVAVDGYYLEALDPKDQALHVGLRAMAYRGAFLIVGGPLLVLISEIGWLFGILICAAGAGMLAVLHERILPRVETRRRPIQELMTARVAVRAAGVSVVLAGLIILLRSDPAVAVLDAVRTSAPGLFAVAEKIGWSGFIALLFFATLVGLLLARRQILDHIAASDSFYATAFTSFLAQPHVGRILAFIVTFRAGESFLIAMRYPFFSSVGMSLREYGFANGTLGVLAGLLAAWGGGYIIANQGLRRWIWPFVIAQNSLNLLYVAVAAYADSGEPVGLSVLTVAIMTESFGAGLGTAVFMVYMMRCADPKHTAAHMAILTALMSVAFTLSGVVSGFLAESIGFAGYFMFTILIAIPGMAIIPWLPHLDERPGVQE